MATTTAPVTFAEFEALPEIPGKQELLDGEVITLPPPQAGHSNVSHALYDVLRTAVQGQGSSPSAERVVFLEAGYRVSRNPDAFLQPDVSIQYPDQQIIEGYFERSAMLAVDVVSPSNTAHHLERKTHRYFEGGAREAWVVYPESRSVWVYLPDGSAKRVTGQFESALFPGQPIALDSIWG